MKAESIAEAVECTAELVNRVFDLAYFIVGERSSAIYVTAAAMDKLKTASSNQDRRRCYTPTGRSGRAPYPASRTRVNLSEAQLLQRLVYIETDIIERLLEAQRKSVGQTDLIIRYIKHLIMVTTKNNSFYVTLGLCRLLYNFTTAETTDIYNLVHQDPERMRDDHYYRSRKMFLMEELKERFGDFLVTKRGLRRAERFRPQGDSQKYASLVRECLNRFTPWHSTCVLPAEIDPQANVIPQLSFEGSNPDAEHQVELNRIHTLIHPGCFERLILALGQGQASQRLELPLFFAPSEGSHPGRDRFSPAQLTEAELDAVMRHLNKGAARRKRLSHEPAAVATDVGVCP